MPLGMRSIKICAVPFYTRARAAVSIHGRWSRRKGGTHLGHEGVSNLEVAVELAAVRVEQLHREEARVARVGLPVLFRARNPRSVSGMYALKKRGGMAPTRVLV